MRLASTVLACVAASSWIVPASLRAAQEHHHPVSNDVSNDEIGSVHFSTSCAPGVERGFDRGVALLHSFQYEKAREVFEKVVTEDPTCAMALWGLAMTHYHGLWGNGNMQAGGTAIHKALEIARTAAHTTAREQAYIEALAEIYGELGRDARRETDKAAGHDTAGDPAARARAFEGKMAALQAASPDDTEAAIFHALALDITAPRTDKTFANQKRCGEILDPILPKQPHHPGIAHYLIHCYDNTVLAQQGLPAARLYAKIAPASAHANHMPSHIFTRVGSWDESIASNRRSAEVAAADERTSTNGEARDQRLHAMDYLEYAYLQSGRIAEAKAVLNEMRALKPVAGLTLTGDYALAAIPARFAVELGDWQEASALTAREDAVPWAQAITWAAVGVGSARSGNLDRTDNAQARLSALRDAALKLDPYWANQIDVQRSEVAAWRLQATGHRDEAIAALRTAAQLEESMDKHAVTPGPVTPAREMLADLLAMEREPQAALAEYETVLKSAPNRFNALYGAATAAEAAGQAAVAARYFRQLTAVAAGDERRELVAARKKLAKAFPRAPKADTRAGLEQPVRRETVHAWASADATDLVICSKLLNDKHLADVSSLTESGTSVAQLHDNGARREVGHDAPG